MICRQKRYLQLLHEIGDENGKAYGWKSVAARRVGARRSSVVKLLKGDRRVSTTLIERACATLGLSEEYFTDDEGRGYRHFLKDDKGVGEVEIISAIARLTSTEWQRVRLWADGFFSAD